MSRSGPCLVAVASAAPPGTAPGGVVEHLAPSSRARTCSVLLAEPLLDIGVPGCPGDSRGGEGPPLVAVAWGADPKMSTFGLHSILNHPSQVVRPPLFLIYSILEPPSL